MAVVLLPGILPASYFTGYTIEINATDSHELRGLVFGATIIFTSCKIPLASPCGGIGHRGGSGLSAGCGAG